MIRDQFTPRRSEQQADALEIPGAKLRIVPVPAHRNKARAILMFPYNSADDRWSAY